MDIEGKGERGMNWVIRTYIYTLPGFPGGSLVKNLPANIGDSGSVLGWEDPLEKGMETHSSILVWRISWTEETGRLQSTGLQRTGHT